jgi:signal transduction histidine kinase
VRLTIEDDGQGIRNENPRPDQFGLLGMRERAQSIHGVLTIGASQWGGAMVTLSWQNQG